MWRLQQKSVLIGWQDQAARKAATLWQCPMSVDDLEWQSEPFERVIEAPMPPNCDRHL